MTYEQWYNENGNELIDEFAMEHAQEFKEWCEKKYKEVQKWIKKQQDK